MNLLARLLAQRRDRLLVRLGCWLVCCSLIVGLMLPAQRVKAFAVSGPLLGALFGAVLGTYGFSWAASNLDQAGFSDAVYDLLVEWKTETTDDVAAAINVLSDLVSRGLSATSEGCLLLTRELAQSVSTFAEWFSEKYMSAGTSAVICSTAGSIALADGSSFELSVWNGEPRTVPSFGSTFTFGDTVVFANGSKIIADSSREAEFYDSSGKMCAGVNISYGIGFISLVDNDIHLCGSFIFNGSPSYICGGGLISYLTVSPGKVLDIEGTFDNPAVDISEDKALEIAVSGVTALDVEGIVQDAVDQILAGTYAATAEVVEAVEHPVPGEVVDIDGLGLPALGAALTSRFPFSIPWDIFRAVQLLAAPAKAPYFEVDFLEPLEHRVGKWRGDTTLVLDFSEYAIIGQVCRWTSTIGFCLMLAGATKRLIWTA